MVSCELPAHGSRKGPMVDSGMPTVLLVEDDPIQRDLVRRVLERARLRVLTAEDGLAGWQLLLESDPDVVVTDVQMPGMDGRELCRAIKGDPRVRDRPVLMLTALSSAGDRFDGYEAGADDYLCKPFDRVELICRVRALLRVRDLYLRLARANRDGR
jgi:DNA-binding response OmpR family regulator